MKFQFDGVMDMKIREVNENKKQFIALLLLSDEQENMIDGIFTKTYINKSFARETVFGFFKSAFI